MPFQHVRVFVGNPITGTNNVGFVKEWDLPLTRYKSVAFVTHRPSKSRSDVEVNC